MEERQTRNVPKTATEVKELFEEFGIEEARFDLFFGSNKIKELLDTEYMKVYTKVKKQYFEMKVKEQFRWSIAMKIYTVVDLAEKGLMPMEWAEDTCKRILTQKPKVFVADFQETCKMVIEAINI